MGVSSVHIRHVANNLVDIFDALTFAHVEAQGEYLATNSAGYKEIVDRTEEGLRRILNSVEPDILHNHDFVASLLCGIDDNGKLCETFSVVPRYVH